MKEHPYQQTDSSLLYLQFTDFYIVMKHGRVCADVCLMLYVFRALG